MRVSIDEALDLAISYLDNNYIEFKKDCYLNEDTQRVVRMTEYDLSGHNGKVKPHMNFEYTDYKRKPKYHVFLKEDAVNDKYRER